MPRATRYLKNGYLYHLTHRCTNGEFFLRFAFDELTGTRQRYRIVNQSRLLSLTGFSSLTDFATFYTERVHHNLTADGLQRQPHWTEAIAVGSEEFVETAETTVQYRQRMTRYKVDPMSDDSVWAVRENENCYSTHFDEKSDI